MSQWEHLHAWSPSHGGKRVRDLAHQTFGADASGLVASAPGRVNLIGEHTDYNGGLALPIALPHRTYAWVRARTDGRIRCISAQADHLEEVDLHQLTAHDGSGALTSWAAYVAGVPWAAYHSGVLSELQGADIAIDSCVPFGAGLSSSAALECAVAVAIGQLAGHPARDDEQRGRWAQVCVRAENEVAGAPTGGLDQAASLRCQAGHALALDCRSGATQQLPFDLAAHDLTLMVVDTRAEHSLVDGQYASRRADCTQAAALLGVPLLADIPIEQLAAALDDLASHPRLGARVRHVVTEIARTREFIALLGAGDALSRDLDRLGALMYASHASLRDDYQVSCRELDLVVDTARELHLPGARMTGGGFGGSAIALVPAVQAGEFAAAVSAAFTAADLRSPHLYRVEPGAPADVETT